MKQFKPGEPLKTAFPVFGHQGAGFHYLDNAATSQICEPAARALMEFETCNRANVKRGVHRLADKATASFADARQTVASYIGASRPEEVIFTSGTTFGLNQVACGLEPVLNPGDVILLSELEHHSNLLPWQAVAKRQQARIKAIPVDKEGRLDLTAFEILMDERVKIVSVAHYSNTAGTITDLEHISAKTRECGALLTVDGAQASRHGPFDVNKLGADFYLFSGHKAYGPTGSGILWGRYELIENMPPLLRGGEMIKEVWIDDATLADPPNRLEAGTPSIGSVLGLAAALDFIQGQDVASWNDHEIDLTMNLINTLSDIVGITVLGPLTRHQRTSIVTFNVDGVHAHDVCQFLDQYGVALRGGHHCVQPLMRKFEQLATVRASLAPYNTIKDIEALELGLKEMVALLR